MSSKLIPSNPEAVMSIRQLTPNIVTLSVPFLRVGILRIGGRGTISKTPNPTLQTTPNPKTNPSSQSSCNPAPSPSSPP